MPTLLIYLSCRVQPQLVLQVHPQSALAVQPGAAGGNVLYFMNQPTSDNGTVSGISQLSVSATTNQPSTPTSVSTATTSSKTGTGDSKTYSNSTRWSDPETRILLEIWRSNYLKLQGKFRNYQEWEEIANEFNRRCTATNCGTLGPRSGPQCKIRVKNLTSEYKRLKAQNSKSVNKAFHHYYDFLDNVFTKSFSANAEPLPVSSPDASDSRSPLPVISAVTSVTTTLDPNSCVAAALLQDHVKQEPVTTPLSNKIDSEPTISSTAVEKNSQPLGLTMLQELAQTSVTKTRPILPKLPASTSDTDTSALGYVIRHEPPVVLTEKPETPEAISLAEPIFAASTSSGETAREKGTKRPPGTILKGCHKKKLKKSVRGVKRMDDDEDRLVKIFRELIAENQKRDKELFSKMMEMQLESERRNQEFILKVFREMGNIFKTQNS